MTVAGENTETTATPAPPAAEATALTLWNQVTAEREADLSADTFSASPESTEDVAATMAKASVETSPAIAAETVVEADPFAGLSPAVVDRLKRLDAMETQLAQIPSLQRSLSEAQGRVSAMQRELSQARTAARAVAVAPTATQITTAAKTTEKWDALKTDFPEWADATAEFVQANLAGLTPQQSAGLSPDDVESRIEQRVTAALQQAEYEKVADRYPDWQSTVKQSDFMTWS